MNKKFKFLIVMLFSFFIFTSFNYKAYASEGDMIEISNENSSNKTLDEVEKILFNYFEKNNLNYKLGSDEYIYYLTSILLEDKDSTLSKHPDYNSIIFYASEYLINLEGMNSSNSLLKSISSLEDPIKKIRNEKIIDLQKAINKKNKIIENDIIKEKNAPNPSFRSSYNRNAAVNYALKWATSRNRQYQSYPKDCTNFVSQAVHAGGMPMKKDSKYSLTPGLHSTTSYWYSNKFVRVNAIAYSDSSSWVGVSDFYKYWAKTKTTKVAPVTGTIAYYANVGDVVQFRRGNTDWFHSVFVTKKLSNTILITGHTSDYRDKNITDVKGTNYYRLIKF